MPVIPKQNLVQFAARYHENTSHPGRSKLTAYLESKFWHPALKTIASDVCLSCMRCQKYKTSAGKPRVPIRKIQSRKPFELVAIDLLQLPRTRAGYIGCIVVVDHFSKWAHVAPIRNKRGDTVAQFPTI